MYNSQEIFQKELGMVVAEDGRENQGSFTKYHKNASRPMIVIKEFKKDEERMEKSINILTKIPWLDNRESPIIEKIEIPSR